eukprot:2954500-Pleurochrysis_carterae.AAC.1
MLAGGLETGEIARGEAERPAYWTPQEGGWFRPLRADGEDRRRRVRESRGSRVILSWQERTALER